MDLNEIKAACLDVFVQTLACSGNRGVKPTASEEKAQNGQRKNREKRGGGYCECCMIKYESVARVSFMRDND